MPGDDKGERDDFEPGGAREGSREEVRSDQAVKDKRGLLRRRGQFRPELGLQWGDGPGKNIPFVCG